jgi:twitching motility two-component system response regulator PilG
VQGELSEIDVRSILQLVELGQRTGQLWLRSYPATTATSLAASLATGPVTSLPHGRAARSWLIFFANGKIVYAGDPDAGFDRLQDLLQRHQIEVDWNNIVTLADQGRRNTPEYGCLWTLIEQRLIQPDLAKTLLDTMIRETVFEILSLHQGTFVFEVGHPLLPQLMSLETSPLIAAGMKQVQEWKQFYPQIQSLEQYPVIVDGAALGQALPAATVKALVHYADQQLSLRKLARALNRDISTVARAIYPCIQRGWLTLGMRSLPIAACPVDPAIANPTDPQVHIVCIDDAIMIGQLIASMLEPKGYRVSPIADPIAALGQLFQYPPELILCDIEMPHLDGYELCAMLRQSSRFHQTPIVMLTGKDGFIDRVRARMVGATDYLAKPFKEEELVMIVERYLVPTVRMTGNSGSSFMGGNMIA